LATGKITRVVRDRGFGFIKMNDSNEEVFFHTTALVGGGFDDLQEGQAVEFNIQPDPRNPSRTRASDVRPVTA
jgi:CspA family cold shock protein